ncbi:MAG TPA: Hpt domain-containing protein [Burkholderiales bacterium]|nr:Hpt domain-containing protein [Burkholderiales bacterium]
MSAAFDIGPLGWVKSEIDSSLERARAALRAYGGKAEAQAELKACEGHLHQASGAVQIVGLEGVTRFFEQAEALLADLQAGKVSGDAATVQALERAIGTIGKYLADLLDGAADQPLRMFPAYRALLEARGAPPPSEADLYFPDLSLAPPAREHPALRLPHEESETFLRTQRLRYQRGFVKWLRDAEDRPALGEMLAAVDAVEATQALPPQRAFWWTAGALIDALAHGDLAPEPALRQVAARIEQQLRRMVEGASASVAEQLQREVLYWLARSGKVRADPEVSSARARAARQAYRLDGSLPSDSAEPDISQRVPMALALREAIGHAKEAWNKYVAGIDSALAAFSQHASAVAERGWRLGNLDLATLTREIARIAAELEAAPRRLSDSAAMEVATALLVAENAAENYRQLPPDFDRQVKVMLSRLAVAVFNAEAAGELPDADLIDAMMLRAQEKLALGSALAEMQANLHRIEQTLDVYFRDPTRAAELAALDPLIHQVAGALGLLGEEEAQGALERCAERIRAFAGATTRPALEEFEAVAQILSGLGFYIDALRHGKADFAAAMRPVGAAQSVAAPSVEKELRQKRRDTQALYEALRRSPQDQEIRTRLRGKLSEIKDDAQLVADASLGSHARDALSQLDTPESLARESPLARSMAQLAPPSESASPDAQRLLKASNEAFDQELLAIFLEEADGVLAAIAENLAASRVRPGAMPELAAIRRAFHTLKGSGRMVGLARLADTAWALEQLLNLWLHEERAATPALHEVIEVARETFADWVGRLQRGEPQPDAEGLLAAAERLGRGETPVAVGTAMLSPSLYAVFVNEAQQHLETLERELAAVAASGSVHDDLVRAAHTLAGICGTVQMEPMHALGYALEGALLRLRSRGTPVETAEVALLARSAAALRDMHAEVAARRAPAAQTDLARALEALPGRAEPLVAPPAEGPAERRRRRVDDDLDGQLLPLFLEEAGELVPQAGELLRAWRKEPAKMEHATALQRALHTLKGSARMAGVMSVGELTHNMEARVENTAALERASPQLLDELDVAFDRLGMLLEGLQKTPAPQAEAPASVAAPPKRAPSRGMLRVRSEVLEKLVNEAGEVAITRSRIEVEMRVLKNALADLTENVLRLRGQLREIEIHAESQMQAREREAEASAREFDPLEFDRFTRFQELTRMMAESVNDVSTVQQSLTRMVDNTDAALSAQARLNRELQQDLMRVRMVPFGTLAERLHRLVRQTAKELGKRAGLELRGASVELDRSVLERITGPLEHLVRNALTHGIEPAEERAAAGKPEAGEIRLDVRQEGNEIVLSLADDGAGLDLGRIRDKALQRGLIDAAEQISEQRLAELIFVPGFSTVEQVTEIAGRGVGMDVVKDEVGGLGGRIELESAPRRGTRFTVRLPLTTAVTQAVLVKSGARTCALPAVMIEQVQQLRPEQLEQVRAAGHVEWAGRHYSFAAMHELLGEAPAAQGDAGRRYSPVLLLRSGAEAAAVLVDEMIGNQEVVVKDLGPQLARVPGVAGVTVLGSGEIVLILNPVALVQRPRPQQAHVTTQVPAPAAARLKVMVVDDSLTVRKITGRLLEREGYQVLAAKDGVEALEQLSETVPDVMLVDIEMPRMDGFDLTRNVRADPRLKSVPIIVITSRTADKHRAYAQEVGANAFLGKPYQEEQLLGHIASFVGRRLNGE